METIITSPSRVVKIGPDHPFVIIGERINPQDVKNWQQRWLPGILNGYGQTH
jgi:cobalamin-dependent methionine synthase I